MAEDSLRPGSIGWSGGIALLAAVVLVSSQCRAPSGTPVSSLNWGVIQIPRGPAPNIDGVLSLGEWSDTAQVIIRVDPSWEVKVLLKQDAENLYLAFQGMEYGGRRLFPEVMIDPELRRRERWSAGQLWLHVSQNLCEGSGEFNVYERSGVFECGHTKSGWEANNPPNGADVIEVRVSFEKMGRAAQKEPKERMIGLALDVTDATGGATQLFRYWPESAGIAQPATWGVALLQ
jgi:hypothetical protein